jgi:branched-chain amino acid aminotransferase
LLTIFAEPEFLFFGTIDVANYINFNGDIIRSDEPVIIADNRGLRYGDGIFETMRIGDGSIIFSSYHFDRLFSGIRLLQFDHPAFFSREILEQEIIDLCTKNHHQDAARVRLAVFRGKGGLYDPENHNPNYIIESWPLAYDMININDKGLRIDIFPDARKSTDIFSNLKSNNYLLYAMGALYAKKNLLNDCLILNSHDRICDTTIANIFCMKDNEVFTPALSEGCVSGVMRRHLLTTLPDAGFAIHEIEMEIDWLQTVDEIFLTNALYGIRWVEYFQNKLFSSKISFFIYNKFIRDSR